MLAVNSNLVNNSCCTICQDEIFKDNFNNVVVVACCKSLIHKDCWQGWENHSAGVRTNPDRNSRLAFRRCTLCPRSVNALPLVSLATIAYQNSDATGYLKADDSRYLSEFLKTATEDTSSTSEASVKQALHSKHGVLPINDLVSNELSRHKEPNENGHPPPESSLESFPLQACQIGDSILVSQIVESKPEFADKPLYSFSRNKKLTMAFVAADNQHSECVQKMVQTVRRRALSGSSSTTSCSLTHSLSIAIKESNDRALGILIDAGPDLAENALYEALQENNHDTASMLLGAGVSCGNVLNTALSTLNYRAIDVLIESGVNPVDVLIKAAQENRVEQFKFLLNKQYSDHVSADPAALVAAIRLATNHNMSALHILKDSGLDPLHILSFSINRQNHNATKVLLEAGADPYLALSLAAEAGNDAFTSVFDMITGNHNEHLCRAAESGNLPLVKCLLNAGIDPIGEYNDGDPLTPLFIAAGNRHSEVVSTIFDFHNPDDQIRNMAIGTAALSSDDNTLLTLLGSYRSEDEKIEGITRVMLAAIDSGENGKQVLKRLIKLGEAGKSSTILLNAAIHGNRKILENLLKAGANANTTNSNGWSLLHIAASKGNQNMVQRLIDMGASINNRSGNGETVLAIAASRGQKAVVNTLIKSAGGTDINSEVEEAVERGDHEMLDQLLGLANYDGKAFRQLLWQAASKNNTEVLKRMQNKNPVSTDIAFTEAFNSNELQIVAEFLQAGIGKDGGSPLSLLLMAAVYKDEQKVKIMIQNGVEASADIFKAAAAQEIEALSILLSAFADNEAKNTLISDLVTRAIANRNQAVFSSLASVEKQCGTVGIGNILSSALTQLQAAQEAISDAQNVKNMAQVWINENWGINHGEMDTYLQQMDANLQDQYQLNQASIDCSNDAIQTHMVQAEKAEAVIQSFITARVDLNMTDDSRQTLLCLAIVSDHHVLVKAILDSCSKADTSHNIPDDTALQTPSCPNSNRKNRLTDALLLAINLKKWDMAELILHKTEDSDSIDSRRLNENSELLYEVAQDGNNLLLNKLWSLGVHATPALNKAIGESNTELIKRFADAGIKLRKTDDEGGLHPLLTAAYMQPNDHSDNLRIVQLLLSLTENLDEFFFNQALLGQKHIVLLLWTCGGQQYDQIMSMLTRAVDTQNYQIFKILNEMGDDIANTLSLCLFEASLQGNQKVVKELLDINVDINVMKGNPAQFLYNVAVKDHKIASMLLNAWKEKVNRNCPVIIAQACELARQQNDGHQQEVIAFLTDYQISLQPFKSSP